MPPRRDCELALPCGFTALGEGVEEEKRRADEHRCILHQNVKRTQAKHNIELTFSLNLRNPLESRLPRTLVHPRYSLRLIDRQLMEVVPSVLG